MRSDPVSLRPFMRSTRMRFALERALAQAFHEVINVAFDFFLLAAVALLEDAAEPQAIALDDVEIVVGELAPLALERALPLFPVALDLLPVPVNLLSSGPYAPASAATLACRCRNSRRTIRWWPAAVQAERGPAS